MWGYMDLQSGLRLVKSKYGAKGKEMKDVLVVPREVNNPTAGEAKVGGYGNPTERFPEPILMATKTNLAGTVFWSLG